MSVSIQAQPMAKRKIDRKDEKSIRYGVPVACRVDADLAFRMSEKAEKLGISLAKYAAILIQRGESTNASIEDVEKQLEKEKKQLLNRLNREKEKSKELENKLRTIHKNTMVRFLQYACNGSGKRHRELIEKYNEMYELSESEYNLK